MLWNFRKRIFRLKTTYEKEFKKNESQKMPFCNFYALELANTNFVFLPVSYHMSISYATYVIGYNL